MILGEVRCEEEGWAAAKMTRVPVGGWRGRKKSCSRQSNAGLCCIVARQSELRGSVNTGGLEHVDLDHPGA